MGKVTKGLSEQNKKDILEVLLSTGGDFAEVFMEDTISETIEMISGRVSRTDVSKISGAAVRVIKNHVEVNCSTSDYSFENLLKVAKDLAESFDGEKETAVVPFLTMTEQHHVVVEKECTGDNEQELTLMKKATEACIICW